MSQTRFIVMPLNNAPKTCTACALAIALRLSRPGIQRPGHPMLLWRVLVCAGATLKSSNRVSGAVCCMCDSLYNGCILLTHLPSAHLVPLHLMSVGTKRNAVTGGCGLGAASADKDTMTYLWRKLVEGQLHLASCRIRLDSVNSLTWSSFF